MKAVRVKTVWFRKGAARSPAELASVLASTLWRLADKLVDNLSRAEYDIVTPERGFRIIAEVLALGLHLCDRWAWGRIDDRSAPRWCRRSASAWPIRWRATCDGTRENFIDMLNRRGADYAGFDIPAEGAGFPVLRYLAAQVREAMDEHDQHWVMDQMMEIELPEALGTLKKTFDGLIAPASTAP